MEIALKILGWVVAPICTLIIGALWTKLHEYKKNSKERDYEEKIKHDAMFEACKFMLRELLKDDYEFHVEQEGWCSIEDKAYIQAIYDTYHTGLHGNGQGTRYYEAIMALPEHKPTDKKD